MGYNTKYLFGGEYEGKILYSIPKYNTGSGDYRNSDESVYLLNMETGESELVLEIKRGGLLGKYSGDVFVDVFDDTKLLYCIYNDSDMADIYTFNLEDRSSEYLFEDIHNISFSIIGETSDTFIGEIYNGKDTIIYMLSKEAYYNGNLDEAVKLSL